jgi:hypothetical protein
MSTHPRPSRPRLSPSGEVRGQIGPGSTRTLRWISIRSPAQLKFCSQIVLILPEQSDKQTGTGILP